MVSKHIQELAGSWAVITGGSDGTGEAFVRRLGALGFNLLLIARRPEPLAALAAEIRQACPVEVRTASIDLYQADAGARVIEAAADLEVGLFISNAGSDPHGSAFLDTPVTQWGEMINRNVCALVEPAHAFAAAMKSRGRGGIVVMSSGAALGGQPGGAVYSASKAFGLNFAESLSAELRPFGVHVLCAVCSAMNTPSLTNLLAKRNLTVPGLFEPDDVIETLLENFGHTAAYLFPFAGNDEETARIQQERESRLAAMEEISRAFYGDV